MSHNVRGYFKKDGTYVRPHRRRNPTRRQSAIGAGVAVTITISGFIGFNLLRTKPSIPKRSGSPAKVLSIEAQTGFKRTEAALLANNFKPKLAINSNTDCATVSYGQVHNYFQSNPCKHMARAYMQIGEAGEHLILVAISWVAMPTTTSAQEYKRLIDIGAGGITELSRETKLFKTITYEDATHTSGIKGTFVWNVKVMPMYSATPDEVSKVVAASQQQ